MNYKVYKLEFKGAVHFGKSSLEEGEYTFCADTLFSALCQEAVKMGETGLQTFYQCAKDGNVLFSDAFPYEGATYYLPKPMLHIESSNESGDSIVKKAYKKLKYIPVGEMDCYLKGKYDVLHAGNLSQLGCFEMKVSASISGEEQTMPYRIGTYRFYQGKGLYIIVGYTDEKAQKLTEELLNNLSFSGIGGERASGMGRFTVQSGELDANLAKRLNGTGKKYMTLSLSLPKEEELEACLENATYAVMKRSGFVQSETYAKEQMRKRDLYVLKAGTCVETKYEGDIYDVSDKIGRHPVYKYAKPIFMEVDA